MVPCLCSLLRHAFVHCCSRCIELDHVRCICAGMCVSESARRHSCRKRRTLCRGHQVGAAEEAPTVDADSMPLRQNCCWQAAAAAETGRDACTTPDGMLLCLTALLLRSSCVEQDVADEQHHSASHTADLYRLRNTHVVSEQQAARRLNDCIGCSVWPITPRQSSV